MDVSPVMLELVKLLRGLVVAYLLSRLLLSFSASEATPSKVTGLFPWQMSVVKIICLCAVAFAARFWHSQVDRHVPEPYLVTASPIPAP